MEANYKKFRKTPPYMTKTGVKIGLLYQEPFEARMGKDEYAWQQTFLEERYGKHDKPYLVVDSVIVVICVVALIGIVIGGIYGIF